MNAALRETLSPFRHACGGLKVRVNGEACVLRCSGALWVPERRTLIASDLHLEKGSAFAARGQMLPPYDSPATIAKLEAEVEALDPGTVVLLGDSFHDSRAVDRLGGDGHARLGRMARGRSWIWLEGNHDLEALAGALDRLTGEVVATLQVGALTLIHEPQAGASPGEVAGHLHPAARVAAYGRGVRRPCFVTDGGRLVMPAFGAFTGGLDVRDAAVAGLFGVPPLVAALGRDKVHAIGWDRLA
ncbi:MAG: ligase-associated DNA damage response endonuclease PdeM [Alphaproteobacteria bacterium]|nr:ligase-associated DNA damage response endonuclease PdeM [Alphaproteobacteria bacterium]MBU1527314.1 ligase-associated DNA damage response endonuclease PdeM [Alphaproteobacteria bacterium]MBU2116200.1 ligase-associated DNA damage response endonuclease PdeM [Alphaproteobacteria bacterium]MBU2352314.1 ligase-associated DNA damage response endonuclease PdeM [Alphaproteobacteria bacterium]MBU2383610.1 ligase-associated DNA damage response endonuclease PdeM [Alphaproteobacteria bacterium]